VRGVKKRPTDEHWVALVATVAGSVWLERRESGLFAALWNPFWIGVATGVDDRDRAREILRARGLRGRVRPKPEGEVEHQLTHRTLHARVWRAVAVQGPAQAGVRRFAAPEIGVLGVSTFGRKLMRVAGVQS
jgi:adenine-specific DNA glycosylase